MPAVTTSRLDAVQRCPLPKKAPSSATATARFRSASSSTTSGFFPPHLQLKTGGRGGRVNGQFAPDASGPGEGESLDTRITDQLGGHRTWYKDVIEHALRYARLDKHVAQSTGDGRGNGRRLEHYSVTKGQSRGTFPGGDRNGEVPGRDQPHDTDRVTPCGRLPAHAPRPHATHVTPYCPPSAEAEKEHPTTTP